MWVSMGYSSATTIADLIANAGRGKKVTPRVHVLYHKLTICPVHSRDAAIMYGEELEDICDDSDAAIVHGDKPEDSRDDTRVVSPPTSGKISADSSLLSAVFSWESD